MGSKRVQRRLPLILYDFVITKKLNKKKITVFDSSVDSNEKKASNCSHFIRFWQNAGVC